MNRAFILAAMAACFGLAAAAASPPPVHQASARDAARTGKSLGGRGAYLSRAAGCLSCHTGSSQAPFAGGRALQSAFGTIYSTNITSESGDGIGNWTRQDFERALRQGIRKDGQFLYPAMPYTSYTKMSDQDMEALWTFVHGIAPVKNTIPKNTLPFPLSVRSGMAVWQSLYFKPGRLTATSGKSPAWNRGAYLVQALGHCGECHTPRNIAQAPKPTQQMTGAAVEGWYAPDISNDSLSTLSSWTVTELAKYLKDGAGPKNTKAFGPMLEVIQDGLQHLTGKDLLAMAVYLKDQDVAVQHAQATKPSYPDVALGKRVYEERCATCHQTNGQGVAGSVPALAGDAAIAAAEPYDAIMAVLEGFPPQGSWGSMASFADKLTDDEISAVANYIRISWGNGAPANATPWTVAAWRNKAEPQDSDPQARLCPNLDPAVVAPALNVAPDQLQQAARDSASMQALVGRYRVARPQSSTAQVVEALSTAYCRQLSTLHLSSARMGAMIANFSQRVAQVPATEPVRQ